MLLPIGASDNLGIPPLYQRGVIADTEHRIADALDPESQIKFYFNDMLSQLAGKGRIGSEYFSEQELGAEILLGKRITMVEDMSEVIGHKYPDLLANTAGKARFIYVDENTETDSVTTQLLEQNPDIILMDQDLTTIRRNPETKNYDQVGSTKYGTDIIRALRIKGYTGTIIGTSSDASNHAKMMAAGANNCFDKSESGFIQTIAKIVQEQTQI